MMGAEGIKRGRLSQDEEAAIVALGESLTAGQIARRLNRHPATVGLALHRFGLATVTRRSFRYFRNGREVRSFSPEEDAFITALRVAGAARGEIAERVKDRFGYARTPDTIGIRLTMLANTGDE